MSIDYKQLKTLVKEAIVMEAELYPLGPSAPEGIPHRMPAAEDPEKEQDRGDPAANKLYDLALVAREAAENLVEKLDDPFYDDAYENAFKASACLRRALNSLEESGAHPMPDQRVVAPRQNQQRFNAFANDAGDYSGGMGMAAMPAGLAEASDGEINPEDLPDGLGDARTVANILNMFNTLSSPADKGHILTVLGSQGLKTP